MEGRFVAQRLERTFAVRAILGPKFIQREIDVVEGHHRKFHASDCIARFDTAIHRTDRFGAMAEFTFFVDADLYQMNGGELAADEADLHAAGVESVDIPNEYGADLGMRIPVRVTGTPKGLRFYARLLGVRDTMQLEELERVLAAADARGEWLSDL